MLGNCTTLYGHSDNSTTIQQIIPEQRFIWLQGEMDKTFTAIAN